VLDENDDRPTKASGSVGEGRAAAHLVAFAGYVDLRKFFTAILFISAVDFTESDTHGYKLTWLYVC